MKACLQFVLLMLPFSICLPVAMAGAGDKTPAGFRLAAELRDGSRVIGTARDEYYRFDSPTLGGLKLPLEKIRSLEALDKTNLVLLTAANGDTLKAKFLTEDVRVETGYGLVRLPVAQIRSLHVTATGGAGRPRDGLVALWSAEGGGADSVGGNNGTPINVAYTDGVTGKAFTFAPDNYPYGTWVGVQIQDRPAYALTKSLTVDAWARPRGNGYVISFRGDHRPGLDPFSLSMDGHGNIGFGVCDAANTSASVHAPVANGAWIHCAGVLDGDAGTLSLYTNGVLAAQINTDIRPFGGLLPNESPGVGIGNVNDGGNNFPFVGDIGQVGLYDRALSADEVKAIYLENAANADGRASELPTRNNNIRRYPYPSFGGKFMD